MRQSVLKALGTLLVLSFVAIPAALAGEGRIPIYQSETITDPGYYQLTRDISGSFTIESDDVVLDLGGWHLETAGFGTGVTIQNGTRSVTVRNGRITAHNGVDVQGGGLRSGDIVVEDISFVSSNRAIDMDQVDSAGVYRNRVDGATIRLSGGGEPLLAHIIGNVITNPGQRGLDLYQLTGGAIVRNSVIGASGTIAHGIFISGTQPAGGNLIADNVVRDLQSTSANQSAFSIASPGNHVRGNTAESNEQNGFLITSNYNRVENNHANNNGGEGFWITGDNNDLSGNTSFGNGTGLLFHASANGNIYDGNRVCANTTDLDDSGTGGVIGTNFICVP